MKRIPKDTWLLVLALAIFLAWKLSTLHFRFGDENVYFYMTKAIKDGLVPYKDFNLADPPAFIYLLTAFSALIGKHFILFKLWPPLFDAASAVLIFSILKKSSSRFAALGSALYLFSFTVLSTSDYVTGAETTVFLILLAIYLDMRKHSVWSGVVWALACLCKLYAAPALIGYLGYKLYKKEFRSAARTILSGALVGVIILLPFFISAPHQTLSNLIVYQLHRPAGIGKAGIFELFFGMEWLLVLASLVGAFYARDKRAVWPLLLSFVFLVWFKDLYYLYLHLLLPFLAILAAQFVDTLEEKKSELAWGFIGLYAVVFLYPLFSYIDTYAPQGIFNDPEEVAQALVAAPKDLPVYGVQEAAPLVALMADKPLFEHVIDTNTQNFLSGALNEKDISEDIQKSGAYLLARVADYPTEGIMDTGFESYFSRDVFKASCTKYKTFSRPDPGNVLNDVAIYTCL